MRIQPVADSGSKLISQMPPLQFARPISIPAISSTISQLEVVHSSSFLFKANRQREQPWFLTVKEKVLNQKAAKHISQHNQTLHKTSQQSVALSEFPKRWIANKAIDLQIHRLLLNLTFMRVQSSELPSYKSRSYHSSLASIKMTPQNPMAEDRQKSARKNHDDGLRNYENSHRSRETYEARGEYKSDRLMVEEIVPSFREKYEVYELLQQISENKRTIDIKNKEIFYLSNQIVSVKDEYAQKILQLECLLSQLKREAADLRFNGIKTKKEETQKSAKLISQVKSSHELELYNVKLLNQQMQQKLGEQHKRQIENIEQKYRSILGLEKREKLGVIEVWEQKGRNNDIFLNDIKEQNVKLRAAKEQLWEEKNSMSKNLQEVKSSLEELKQKSTSQQNLYKSQIQALKESLQKQQSTNQALQQEISRLQSKHQSQVLNLQSQISIHKQQQNKLKQLILSKDKSLQKLEQKSVIHHEQKPQIDPIRICHHNGLILQLERNLAIKQKQNIDLRGQLEEWGKHIGFEKGAHSRLGGLIEVSSEALQVQQSFNSSLRRMGKKMGI